MLPREKIDELRHQFNNFFDELASDATPLTATQAAATALRMAKVFTGLVNQWRPGRKEAPPPPPPPPPPPGVQPGPRSALPVAMAQPVDDDDDDDLDDDDADDR